MINMKEKKEKTSEGKEEGLEKVKEKLRECKKEKEEYLAGWKRARADFINYKKEEKERMERFLKFSSEGLILELLPILDDLEKAEDSLSREVKENSKVKGLLQIKKKLVSLLEKEGVEEIKIEAGEKFDPSYAEAVDRVQGEEEDKISRVLQKGYRLHNKVIRPAKVVVTTSEEK